MKEEIKAYNSVLDLIGNTPLIKLNKISADLPGNFYAKVEAFNPGHSTKDRIALYIIEEAEKRGILKPGDTIIETTSGNTGFSLAMVSIIKGYDCILAVSSKSSKDKIDMLRSMGAKVYVCPAHVSADDDRSYYNVAKRLHEETKGSVYINQYFNELNVEAHYNSTGPEIWEDTDGQVDIFVAGVGTGGTVTGVGEYLKSKNPDVKVVAVEPKTSPVLSEGKAGAHKIQGIGAGFIPRTYNSDFVDEVFDVENDDAILAGRQLAQQEGLLVGISSGAAAFAGVARTHPDFPGRSAHRGTPGARSGLPGVCGR